MARTEHAPDPGGDARRGEPRRRRHDTLAWRAVRTLLLTTCLAAASAAETAALALRDDWTGFFGGAEAALHVALPADQAVRVHGFRAVARAALAADTATHRALVEAYAAGVNAGLAALG
ncbi:MAG TPA: penicillin acylase family protein, partial [Phycisphaerae bacterium]|nr:penicillin acylase family protein [Phycisphaerae bacterium]